MVKLKPQAFVTEEQVKVVSLSIFSNKIFLCTSMSKTFDTYLTMVEAAIQLSVSKSTIIRRMFINGVVPHKSGNKYLILKSKLSEIAFNEYYWWQKRPDIVKHWHPKKNKTLSPKDIKTRSKRKVWWICSHGHEHKARVWSKMRRRYFSCFICSHEASASKFYKPKHNRTLAKVAPNLLKEWDFGRNYPLTPNTVGCGSSKRVWWICKNNHNWQAIINNRVNGNGCPICNNQVVISGVNSLADTHAKEVALLWDFKRNNEIGISPNEISAGNGLHKIYWKCAKNKNHKRWQTTVEKVVLRGHGCPECSRKSGKIYFKDSLIVTHPELVKSQWDYSKNDLRGIYPDKVSSGRKSKVAWKCDVAKDHRWDGSVHHRAIRGDGCPFCANKIVVKSNCLATTHSDLCKEWNYQRNSDCTPEEITAGSNRKVIWRCRVNHSHEWVASVNQRVRAKTGCPHCHLLPESAQEIRIRFELMHIFVRMHNSNYKVFIKERNRVLSGDIYIPELNLIIEFDGCYWHRNSLERDKEKTRLLRQQGINIIRVREFPLKKITRADVIPRVNTPLKKIVDAILENILTLNICNKDSQRNIAVYIKHKDLKNQRKAERYIRKKRAA